MDPDAVQEAYEIYQHVYRIYSSRLIEELDDLCHRIAAEVVLSHFRNKPDVRT